VTSIAPTHVFPATDAGCLDHEAPTTFQAATRAFQRQFLLETLESADWNVTEAARRLDIARSHVYNLIHTFELSRDDQSSTGAPRH